MFNPNTRRIQAPDKVILHLAHDIHEAIKGICLHELVKRFMFILAKGIVNRGKDFIHALNVLDARVQFCEDVEDSHDDFHVELCVVVFSDS